MSMFDTDANAIIQAVLRRYGLEGLSEWAWERITDGASAAQVELELRETEQFRTRFRAIVEREARGLPAISPEEVLEYERRRTAILRSYGFPSGFYDEPDDAADGLINDVSLDAVEERAALWVDFAEASTAPEMRAELERLYGVGLGGLAAYMMDEERATSTAPGSGRSPRRRRNGSPTWAAVGSRRRSGSTRSPTPLGCSAGVSAIRPKGWTGRPSSTRRAATRRRRPPRGVVSRAPAATSSGPARPPAAAASGGSAPPPERGMRRDGAGMSYPARMVHRPTRTRDGELTHQAAPAPARGKRPARRVPRRPRAYAATHPGAPVLRGWVSPRRHLPTARGAQGVSPT